MPDVNIAAVAVAVVAVFVASSVYYIALGRQYAEVSQAARDTAGTRPSPVKALFELVRCLVVVLVFAGIAAKLHVTTLPEALALAVVAWIGFPVVLLAGSVQWEKVPWRLAAIHAGDWLLKLALISCVVGLWR